HLRPHPSQLGRQAAAEMARAWYERARELGSSAASQRLEMLTSGARQPTTANLRIGGWANLRCESHFTHPCADLVFSDRCFGRRLRPPCSGPARPEHRPAATELSPNLGDGRGQAAAV